MALAQGSSTQGAGELRVGIGRELDKVTFAFQRAEGMNRGKEPQVLVTHECQVFGLAYAYSGEERKHFEQG